MGVTVTQVIASTVNRAFQPTSGVYWTLYSLLIIFFSYFYTAIIFNPVDVADNLKRNNGFIPGIRPGKRTSEYIDRVLNRITLPGSIYLAVIARIPVPGDSRVPSRARCGGRSRLHELLRWHGSADRCGRGARYA